MTIRKLSYIFYLTTTVLIALLTLFVVLRFFESRKLDDALNVRHASFLAADELRQSSDDLTRIARCRWPAIWACWVIPALNPRQARAGRYDRNWNSSGSRRRSLQNLTKPKPGQTNWSSGNAGG